MGLEIAAIDIFFLIALAYEFGEHGGDVPTVWYQGRLERLDCKDAERWRVGLRDGTEPGCTPMFSNGYADISIPTSRRPGTEPL